MSVNEHDEIMDPGTTQLERITALMQREIRIRYSGGTLGYAWAYVTPIAWITFIVTAFRILDRGSPIAVDTAIFVATGILPYVLFRQTVTSMMRSLQASRFMIYFQPTSIGEILLASALMELLNMIIMSVVIFGTIIMIFDVPMPANMFTVATGMFLTWFLAAGFGRFAAVLGRLSDTFARALPIILRPLFWTSGIFYIAAELPGGAQDILWYSPLFHSIEIVRTGFFLDFWSPISEPMMPLGLGIFFLLLSFSVERYWQEADEQGGTL